ncbi:hypothetical protein [Pontibacter rugosus]
MSSYRFNLQDSYREFLYSMRTFLTSNLSSERLARELIQSRQKRAGEYILRARGNCSTCRVSYESLYMAYVLEQLYQFLGQQPGLEETGRELRIMAGPLLEKFIKHAERLDAFIQMKPYMACFPAVV